MQAKHFLVYFCFWLSFNFCLNVEHSFSEQISYSLMWLLQYSICCLPWLDHDHHGWKFSTATGGTGGTSSIRQLSLDQRIGAQKCGVLCPTMFEIRTICEQEWFFNHSRSFRYRSNQENFLADHRCENAEIGWGQQGYGGGGSKESKIWPNMLVKRSNAMWGILLTTEGNSNSWLVVYSYLNPSNIKQSTWAPGGQGWQFMRCRLILLKTGLEPIFQNLVLSRMSPW